MDVPEKHYAIHHETTSPAQLLHFIEHTIPKLLQQSAETFGEKVLFWGTQLKEVKNEEWEVDRFWHRNWFTFIKH